MLNWQRIGLSCVFMVSLALSGSAENPLQISIDDNQLQILNQKQVIMKYAYQNVPFKPYVKELYTPSGMNILRDAPADHLHHHGLMFAFAVNDVSFWGEADENGQQIHRDFNHVSVSKSQELFCAEFTESLEWITPENETVLHEERTLQVYPSPKHHALLLTWNSKCRVPDDKEQVTIGGSHYYGLGMRFLEEMDSIGNFYNEQGTKGTVFRGEERLAPAKWCAYQVDLNGKPIIVAMFDHPSNFRQATWFTMPEPFSYLSATMRYHEKPFQLNSNRELDLTYGVAVIEENNKKEIESIYQFWLNNYQTANH